MSSANPGTPLPIPISPVSAELALPPPDFRLIFESAPDRYLLLLPNHPVFSILAATNAFLRATSTTRDQLIGHGLFEVFPDNANNHADHLLASLLYVIQQRSADIMPAQKYDTLNPDEKRYRTISNSPMFGANGELAYIVHRVEEVTNFIPATDFPADRFIDDPAHPFAEQESAELAVAERTRFTALSADIGAALGRLREPAEMLQSCAESMVTHLHAAFARIWILNAETQTLELRASAGLYTHLDGEHSRIPVGAFKIGWIAQQKKPHLTNDVLHDPRIGDPDWAAREGMVSFAGYPLIVHDCLIGVMGVFARAPLQRSALAVLGSAADTIAVGMDRRQSEEARAQQASSFAQSHADLAQQWQTFDTVLSNTLDHAYTFDLNGRFTYANRALLRRLQKTRSEVFGRRFREVGYPPELATRVEHQIQQVVATRKPVRDVTPVVLPSQETHYYDYIFVPVMNAEGEVQQIAGTTRDVTDQKAREEELKKANRELEEFAFVASHDLQEPLRMINVYTQLILKDLPNTGGKPQQFGQIVTKGVLRMQALLNDLLTYARTGAREDTAPTLANLSDSLSEALLALKSRIEDTGTIVTAPPLPTVWGDMDQLSHVFQNLLANSIKYSKSGVPPEIQVSVSSNDTHWVVSLRDNGIGFAPEYAERIFGLFKRLHKDEYAGTGVGLAICQRIVERHGGRIWAEGQLGEGSTFFISLPRVEGVP